MEGCIQTLENHLKQCKPFLEKEEACSTFSRNCDVNQDSSSKQSLSSLTSSNLKKAKTSSLLGFMDRALIPKEVVVLHQRIIEMIADNAMSFNWIERPSTRCFFEEL